MIEVQSLQKKYGDVMAVDGVSFRADPGKIFGLLGPNGAGKTTTLGCISGLLQPSSGVIKVLGYDLAIDGRLARCQMGVVPQELALYEDLPALENLSFWGGAYGLRGLDLKRRSREILAATGLLDRAGDKVSQFSGGMKRRLNLACAMVHHPKILLLDEPTAGVDPQSRAHLLDLIREEARQGACVLYTTHYMEEAENLCDQLAIMDKGKVIAGGSLVDLRLQAGEKDVLRLQGIFNPLRVTEALRGFDEVEVVHADEQGVRLVMRDASRKLPLLFQALAQAGAEVRETKMTQPNLESLFIKLTGKELRE